MRGVPAPVVRELPAAPPLTAPHTDRIAQLALAEHGGAALTLDTAGELRLWPTLDGTREPIAVRAPAARRLAVGRAAPGEGGALVAALVDAAGGGEVLRFDADGALVGRVALPPEPAIEELAVTGGWVLARRADQTVAAYSARGEVRGRLAPDPGQRIVSLVVRGPRAAAAISASGAEVRALRWLELGRALAWGPAVELPEELTGVSLSPSGQQLAGLAYGQIGRIVELRPAPRTVASITAPRSIGRGDLARFGFRGEDDAILVTRTWAIAARRDAGGWSAAPLQQLAGIIEAAPPVIGDGAAVMAQGAGLALIGGELRHLGYRDLGGEQLLSADPLVLLTPRRRFLWLDDRLRALRALDGADLGPRVDLDRARPLEGPFIGYLAPDPSNQAWKIAIRDRASGAELSLGTTEPSSTIEYDPGTRVLAVASHRGVQRYRISVEPRAVRPAVSPLRGLANHGPIQRVFLTDPALARGVVAVVATAGAALAYAAPDEQPGAPLKLVERTALRGPLVYADRAGRLYASDGSSLEIHRGETLLARHPFAGVRRVAADPAALSVAVLLADELVVLDGAGAVSWRTPLGAPMGAAWLPDGRLAVATQGGLVLFRGGERTGAACGWRFGLHDPKDFAMPTGAASACMAD